MENKNNALNVFIMQREYKWWRRLSPKEIVLRMRWAYQRITRGFCDCDVYNLDYYYTELFKQSIEHLRTHTQCYPNGLAEESWDAYLAEIVEHLRLAQSDDYPNEYEDRYCTQRSFKWEPCDNQNGVWLKESPEFAEIRDKWLNRCHEIDTEKSAHRDKALDMIKARFEDLWD